MTTEPGGGVDSVAPPAALPRGWRTVSTSGPGRFVTHATLERPDGRRVEWSARRHRKGLGFRTDSPPSHRIVSGASATSWAMGLLFGIGSICFAVGSLPPYFDTVSPATASATFFVGSLFFTSAAYLQFHEVLHAPAAVDSSSRPSHLRTLVGWRPRSIDWWAGAVQLAGTVCFNVSTYAATRTDFTDDQVRRLVWAPDVYGSICFLIASWLAYAELNQGILPRPDRSVGWRIVALNLLGSVAFGVSAIAARILPTTGDVANIRVVNLGTFIGAVCFLVGAALLPVESARDRAVA